VLADEVKFPPLFRLIVDCSNLLEVLDGDTGSGFVFDKDVFPRFRVLFVICSLREPNAVVLGVMFDAVLLPRDC